VNRTRLRICNKDHKSIRRGIISLLAAVNLALQPTARAQEMGARAYSPAPVGANVAIFAYAYQKGDVLLDPALPLRDVQKNSRVGATFSYPMTHAHSLKVSWAEGVTARIGGDLNTISVGWQYSWLK